MNAETIIEGPFDKPLLGFRKWKIDSTNNLLLGMNNTPWQPGVNHATGCEDNHASPGSGCHCGFNAWFEESDNDTSGYQGTIGAIAGAGSIELHRDGFRSSEAQVIALLDFRMEDITRSLGKKYGVPVFSDLQKFLEFSERTATPIDDFDIDTASIREAEPDYYTNPYSYPVPAPYRSSTAFPSHSSARSQALINGLEKKRNANSLNLTLLFSES